MDNRRRSSFCAPYIRLSKSGAHIYIGSLMARGIRCTRSRVLYCVLCVFGGCFSSGTLLLGSLALAALRFSDSLAAVKLLGVVRFARHEAKQAKAKANG
jgi:hypothetical protein